MDDPVDLSPARCAELVAPVISRVFISGMRAGGTEGRELVASSGGEAVGYLIDLRNPLAAGRAVTPAGLAEHYRYTDPETRRQTIQRSVDHGLLVRNPDGSVRASEHGQDFLRDLFALHGRVLTERWGPYTGPVARLVELTGRVLAEATAGAAWAVQAPPYEPEDTPPAVLLLNRLSTLRYHRSDAHAAAWRAAGLTAAEMVAMPWGSEWSEPRRAVEHDTNVRAAPPYAVLTPGERLQLLADLAVLP